MTAVSALASMAFGLSVGAPGVAGAASGKPIVIGVIDSATGPLASTEGGFQPAIEAWGQWTNAHGGINGHHLDLIVDNDAGVPATGLAQAQQLISVDHVIAIISMASSETAWDKYATSHNIPVISAAQAGTFANDFDNGTPLVPTQTAGALAAAKKAGGTSVAFLYCAQYCTGATAGAKASAKQLGLKFAYATEVADSAPSYTPECLAAKAAGADILNVYAAEQTQVSVATACQQVGFKFVLAVSDLNYSNAWLTYSVGNGSTSEIPIFPFTDHSTPATKAFQQAMAKYNSAQFHSATFGEIDADAWVAGQEILVAAQLGNVGSGGTAGTSKQIDNGLFAMHNNTLGGLAPPLTFTHKANESANIKCFFIMSIKNNHFVEPQGMKTSCVS